MVMVVVVMVVMVVEVRAGTPLRCGDQCTCELKEKYEKDYNVKCNATMLEEVTVSQDVFAEVVSESQSNDFTGYRTYVLVEGSPSLTLTFTADFFTTWRQFSSCSLDVMKAGRVIFPHVPPFIHGKPLGHYFAGLGLAGVASSEVPVGLFSGKEAAGLRLYNSTLGQLPAWLLKGVASLKYLEVVNSTIGLLEGPLGDPALNTMPRIGHEKRPVLLANSTVGLMAKGALRLHAGQDQKIVLEGVAVGRVEAWAVEVEGAAEVVVRHCTVASLGTNALLLGQGTSLTLAGGWLALRPGALTRYRCDADDRHLITGNQFTLLNDATGPGLQQARQPTASSLAAAVHRSCVAANLPVAPEPLLQAPAPWSAVTWEQMVAFGALGVVVGATVACLSMVAYLQYVRRGRHPAANQPPPMVMSRLLATQEEPIYELPKTPEFRAPRPPLPPLPEPSPPQCRASDMADKCGSGQQQQEQPPLAKGNHYIMQV